MGSKLASTGAKWSLLESPEAQLAGFFGKTHQKIDDKGRVIFPAKYRPTLGERVFVTRGVDGCIVVYPEGEWSKVVEDVAVHYPGHTAGQREYRNAFFAHSSDEKVDSQGRLTIPVDFRAYAEITGEVVICGDLESLQLWEPTKWAAHIERADAHKADNAEQARV